MFVTRACRAAGLLLVLGLAGQAAAQSDPKGVLKSRGLQKEGLYFVLKDEADSLQKMAKIQPQYVRLQRLYSNLSAAFQGQAEYDEMENRYTFVTEQFRNVGAEIEAFPPTSNNVLKEQYRALLDLEKELSFERNALNRELNLRYKTLVPERERKELFNEFQKQRQDFLDKSSDLRGQNDAIIDRYAGLAKDDAVKSALRALRDSTKMRIELGPSPEFKRRSALLKNAEKTVSPETFSTKEKRKNARGDRRRQTAPKKSNERG